MVYKEVETPSNCFDATTDKSFYMDYVVHFGTPSGLWGRRSRFSSFISSVSHFLVRVIFLMDTKMVVQNGSLALRGVPDDTHQASSPDWLGYWQRYESSDIFHCTVYERQSQQNEASSALVFEKSVFVRRVQDVDPVADLTANAPKFLG